MNRPFKDQLVETLPALRAYARSLTGDLADADDLVQETMMKALASASRFEDGSNMRAWLFTILRNTRNSQFRKRAREVEDVDGEHAEKQSAPGRPEATLEMQELEAALSRLPEDQREAVMLIGASGLDYSEASAIVGVSVDALKARVSRGRKKLAALLDPSPRLSPPPLRRDASTAHA